MNAASLALARLQKEEHRWYDYYTGAIADLIDAGLLLPSQVPGTNGNPKVQATYGHDGQLMRRRCYGYAFRVNLKSRGRAQVCVPVDDKEAQRRCKAADEQRGRERLAYIAQERIDCIPRTHDAYRAETRKYARIFLKTVLVNAGQATEHGFRYGDDEQEELRSLCAEIMRVLDDGTTLFDASIQSAALVAEQSTIAQADGEFQRMLRSIVPAQGSHHA